MSSESSNPANLRATNSRAAEPAASAIPLEHLLASSAGPGAGGPVVARGTLVDFLDTGAILVKLPGYDEPRLCDFLQTGTTLNVPLFVDDPVLVWLPAANAERGCVLGRIGGYVPPITAEAGPQAQIKLEAAEQLTLQCGESSLELRKDGKLLIRGVEILSRATRTHRIKGGTVAIN